MLYLHEMIDIVGEGSPAYMDTAVERSRHSESQGISRLFGVWRVIGSTNRWPRVVNLWEMDSWEHWAATLERQFLPDKQDAALAPWWKQALQWRSGGFDRILEPAPYSPSRDALRASGLKSWVTEQTILRTQPGMRADFLLAVEKHLLPILSKEKLSLLGAHSAPMRSDEVVLLWCASDFAALCASAAGRGTDRAWQDWQQLLAMTCLESETMWLVPSAKCFFHPLFKAQE